MIRRCRLLCSSWGGMDTDYWFACYEDAVIVGNLAPMLLVTAVYLRLKLIPQITRDVRYSC